MDLEHGCDELCFRSGDRREGQKTDKCEAWAKKGRQGGTKAVGREIVGGPE